MSEITNPDALDRIAAARATDRPASVAAEITTAEALAALPADGSRVPFGEILPGYPRRDVREVLAELFTVGRATMLHGEGWGRVLPDETTPGTAGARSTEAAPAGARWTAESAVDYVLDRLDADDPEARELWTAHKAARVESGEDDGADETPVADAWLAGELTRLGHQPPAGARFSAEQMGASIDHVEVVAETKEMDAGSGPAAQYVAVRRLADGRVLVAVGSEDEGTEVWAALDPHSWETIRAL